jgi:hypothetical protein
MLDRFRVPWPGGAVPIRLAWFQPLLVLLVILRLASHSMGASLVVIPILVAWIIVLGVRSMRNLALAQSGVLVVYLHSTQHTTHSTQHSTANIIAHDTQHNTVRHDTIQHST